MKPQILYQDDELVVVHKPSGMTVYKEAGSEEYGDCATSLEKTLKGKVFPVHRLDRGTCGVLIFARQARYAGTLRDSFFNRRVKKSYIAWVWGDAPQSDLIQTPLKSRAGAEESAVTKFVCLKKFRLSPEQNLSLVRVEPRTGRFHQIRRHFKSIGHPIVGDDKYGNSECNEIALKRFNVKRPLLSAAEVVFPHPKTHKNIRVTTRPDADFLRVGGP